MIRNIGHLGVNVVTDVSLDVYKKLIIIVLKLNVSDDQPGMFDVSKQG